MQHHRKSKKVDAYVVSMCHEQNLILHDSVTVVHTVVIYNRAPPLILWPDTQKIPKLIVHSNYVALMLFVLIIIILLLLHVSVFKIMVQNSASTG